MNRRQFIIGSTAVVAGCGRKAPPGPVGAPRPTDAMDARYSRQFHLEKLKGHEADRNATFTTPPPSADVLAVAPELKALIKVTVRLHPRYSVEPGPKESKLGGMFWWPADEPWPRGDSNNPLAAVLQLRAEDAPPNWPFRPDTDLFQLFWHPQTDRHDYRPTQAVVRWRKSTEPIQQLVSPPAESTDALMDFVPVPCRLFPERVMEFPNVEALPTVMKDKLAPKPGIELYQRELSVAEGTKVGGYPRWKGKAEPPACDRCKWGMDYLLTVAAEEWTDLTSDRWKPVQNRDEKSSETASRAAGLQFLSRKGNTSDNGNVHVYMCRRCEDWPVRLV